MITRKKGENMGCEKYTKVTDSEFDGVLESIVDAMGAEKILSIRGVYEILREELNDDVLMSLPCDCEREVS